MSANDRQEVPASNSVGRKLRSSNKNNRVVINKPSRSKACLSEDPGKIERQPRRKVKSQLDVERSLDPIMLPDPCVRQILSYLTKKEMKSATAVSKTWNSYIGSMNSFMDGIVYKPKLEKLKGPRPAAKSSTKLIQRPYKHMIAPLGLIHLNYKLYNPIAAHASSLETLEILPSAYDDSVNLLLEIALGKIQKSFDFPMLRELTFVFKEGFFENSKFPELMRLNIDPHEYTLYDQRHILKVEQVIKFLHSMPKLESLSFNLEFESNYQDKIKLPKFKGERPKLQEMYLANYEPVFARYFESTLRTLEIGSSEDEEEMEDLLLNLRNLKSLGCWDLSYYGAEYNFPRNDSIETFKVRKLPLYWSDFRRRSALNDILLALPSLKVLILPDTISGENLKFIANNLCQLERLYCGDMTHEMERIHEEIQGNPKIYKNATFDLIWY